MKKTQAEKHIKTLPDQEVTFKDGSSIFEHNSEYYTAVSEYEQEALLFLLKTCTELKVNFSHTGLHFEGGEEKRDIYNITLKNNRHAYTFILGDSINNTQARLGVWSPMYPGKFTIGQKNRGVKKARQEHRKPNAYDVLSCITYHDIGTFNNFCDELGYDNDSITAQKTYFAIQTEFENVSRLFTSEQIELLSEIN